MSVAEQAKILAQQGRSWSRARVVCERFLENKVHAAQSAAGSEAPLRPAGGVGGAVSTPSGVRGCAPEILTHKQARSQGIRKGGYILWGIWGSSPRKF